MVTICGPPGLWPITQGAGWGRAAVVALLGKVGRHAGMGAACQQRGGPAPEPEWRKLVADGRGQTYTHRATARIA